MSPFVRGISLSVALSLAIPIVDASAQSQEPATDSAIVVEGIKERQRQIRRFVGALTDTHFRGQIPRFDWKVCPVALGLTEVQNRAVTERMRGVAAAAGMPMAERGCDANAILIVTPDKVATMRWLRRAYPELFFNPLGDRIRLDRESPVSAWQIEGRLTRDGIEVPVSGNSYRAELTGISSRITPATRPHFKASVLVIQEDALRGLTTTQLADYAAMRVFARTEPAELDEATVPTILSVIDAPMGAEVPVTLTQWDMGFLRSLYASAENRYAEQQRHEMRRRLEQDLERGGAVGAN